MLLQCLCPEALGRCRACSMPVLCLASLGRGLLLLFACAPASPPGPDLQCKFASYFKCRHMCKTARPGDRTSVPLSCWAGWLCWSQGLTNKGAGHWPISQEALSNKAGDCTPFLVACCLLGLVAVTKNREQAKKPTKTPTSLACARPAQPTVKHTASAVAGKHSRQREHSRGSKHICAYSSQLCFLALALAFCPFPIASDPRSESRRLLLVFFLFSVVSFRFLILLRVIAFGVARPQLRAYAAACREAPLNPFGQPVTTTPAYVMAALTSKATCKQGRADALYA